MASETGVIKVLEDGGAKIHSGWVKFFHLKKGFGFIVDVEDGREYFVHYSSLQKRSNGWKVLYRGEYVQYKSEPCSGGQNVANEVTGIAGGPLLCEAYEINRPEFY